MSAAVQVLELPGYEPGRLRAVPDEPERRWQTLPPARERPVRLALPARGGTGPVPVWTEPPQVRLRLWRLMTTLLEVLDGSRTIGQARQLFAPTAYEATLTRVRAGRARAVQYRLRTLRTCRPTADAIELCGVLTARRHGGRTREHAVIARVEYDDGGWRCTELRVL